MAIITKAIKLETTQQNLIQAVIAKQNDCNSRFLKVTFLDEGSVIPLDSSSTVTINAERKDGASQSFFGVVNGDDTATVPLHSWILELDGVVNCDISIIGTDGSRLTTTTFVVKVEKAACSSTDITNDPQYNVLVNLIEEVNQKTHDLANGIKDTATGNPVVISDFSPFKHPLNITVKSPDSSIAVYGKNLLPLERNTVKKVDGVEFDKGSGSVYVHGTPTAKCKYNILPNSWNELRLPPGQYTFSGCPSGGEAATHQMEFGAKDLNGNVIVSGKDFGNGFTFTTTTAIGEIYCRIVLGVGLKGKWFARWFYPMLSAGTDTDFESPVLPVEYKADRYNVSGVYSTSGTMTLLTNDSTSLNYKEAITVEYNVDTKKYIDKKFAELAAMIVNS